jgi:bifunctional non-homologous end joining protein LigD
VHEHHASHLHYDFRLEMGGVLKSWAIPKGPSLNPRDKRLAVMVEDHPVDYIDFEGDIPEGNYGAGEVVIWDTGTYEPLTDEDPTESIENGKFSFLLHGEKLQGEFNLVRMGRRDKQWLLIKSKDEFASPDWKLAPLLKDSAPAAQGGKQKSAQREKKRTQRASKKTNLLKPQDQSDLSLKGQKKDNEAISETKAFGPQKLSGDIQVKVENYIVPLTNLDKIYWPDEGYTKGDLIRYYYNVAKYLLPYLKDRPLILKRYPNGIKGKFFYQHDVENAPDFVHTVPIEAEGRRVIDYVVCDNLATLLYIVNMGAIAQHPWNSRVNNLDHPDWIVFDLDPEEAGFDRVCEAALATKNTLNRLGLDAYAKTSGSRGIHIYVPIEPIYTYERVADFAELVAILVARETPDIATLERALKRRKSGHVYIDHMQNARGKSVVAPYSVRERAGATVAAPLDWKEVNNKLSLEDFTMETMPQRLKKKGDLFQAVLRKKQHLEEAIAKLEESFEIPRVRRAKA